jgi:hypothetical protein
MTQAKVAARHRWHMPRLVGIISVIVGIVAIVAGIAVSLVVRSELAAQKITVSSDAPFLAGHQVAGPFTAYAEAEAISQHALDAGNGKTYAEIAKDDPTRETVMTADFLQASLYTSVVAFGVAFLVIALGVMFLLVGTALRVLDRRTAASLGAAF